MHLAGNIQAGVNSLFIIRTIFLFFVSPVEDFLSILSTILAPLSDLRVLGVPSTLLAATVAANKVEGPSTVVTYLGILIDIDVFKLKLPDAKFQYIRELVQTWHGRRSGRYKDFESLLGHLSKAAIIFMLFPSRNWCP